MPDKKKESYAVRIAKNKQSEYRGGSNLQKHDLKVLKRKIRETKATIELQKTQGRDTGNQVKRLNDLRGQEEVLFKAVVKRRLANEKK